MGETDTRIWVHAGIDEDAGEYWRVMTSDHTLTHKYLPTRCASSGSAASWRTARLVAGAPPPQTVTKLSAEYN